LLWCSAGAIASALLPKETAGKELEDVADETVGGRPGAHDESALLSGGAGDLSLADIDIDDPIDDRRRSLEHASDDDDDDVALHQP
jgi:hypothetical protein